MRHVLVSKGPESYGASFVNQGRSVVLAGKLAAAMFVFSKWALRAVAAM